MACEAFEEKILELLDGSLAPEEQDAVRRHAAGCEDCRSYLALHERLDAALSSALKPPEPSAVFQRKVLRRAATESGLEERWRLLALLDLLGYASLSILAAFLLRELPPLPRELTPGASLAAVWVSASACVLAALWAMWYGRQDPARR